MSSFGSMFNSYSIAQLNELLEDDEKLNRFVQDMEEIQQVQQKKEMLLTSNRSLAEQNLVLQPTLEEQKNKLTKRYCLLQEGFEAYQLRKSTLDHKSGNSSLDMLLALLQAEGAKIEEETENMAESFLDGDIMMEAFVDDYHSKRKLAHLRRVKIDKLREMVLNGHSLPPAQSPAPRPQEVSARPSPLHTEAISSSPAPQPRRAPPPPPVQLSPASGPALQSPAFSYPSTPYPPVPPRSGQPFPSVNSGYPQQYMSQYPPALPQRPPPRMAPQPGFIMQ
ncbi:VPS37B subunit of ESCRT-I a [Osmerus eperlanus]|uniref:VPS37B subunit of ESCRT-I a n=1 Tax=Osmerus eperlanus TaxID=29151 RepID=UPI002E1339A3